MENFVLDQGVRIVTELDCSSINRGIGRMRRDLSMTLEKRGESKSGIYLKLRDMEAENFHIYFEDAKTMIIEASEELGFLYGLFYISETYLGIAPFWFWNDQTFVKKKEILLPMEDYVSKAPEVRFRGWFINDEVLIDKWSVQGNHTIPWEMAFEALLRCRGNMVIPGTDNNSKKYKSLAKEFGLWITHHHAEPLGAEMFSRRYPELNASYSEHPDLFIDLWEEGIKKQKDDKVVWNLGFRGQGDCPFWASDPRYQTDEARGELISSVIKLQYELIKKNVASPICCTNLYGEVMELYKKGVISLPEDIIKIWADNGYGKMVSRRQGNENPRVYALPVPSEESGKSGDHGIYYHVSFYDLQAANHLTMFPNSLEFINKELTCAFSQGADDYLIVNSSNIKPHVFYLDAMKELWCNKTLQAEEQVYQYVKTYYFNPSLKITKENDELIKRIGSYFIKYSECTVAFGDREDEHAGEQFYNYTTRILTSGWLKGEIQSGVKELLWATDNLSFEEQVRWFYKLCKGNIDKFHMVYQECKEASVLLDTAGQKLLEDSLLLQMEIHINCIQGAIYFCESFFQFTSGIYQKAFYLCGKAKESFILANRCMREAEHDKWRGFYENDCLCDIKQTAYLLKFIMGYIRNYGEGPHFYQWQREFLYKEEDRRVVLLTNMENHLTDEELFMAMKKKFND